MGIDIVHVSRLQFCAAQGILHRSKTTFASGAMLADVEDIGAHAVAMISARILASRARACSSSSRIRMPAPSANDEAVAVFIEWATGTLRIGIAGGEGAHRSKAA